MGNILLVEDEVVIRRSICRLLTRHHHEVYEADSVESALANFSLSQFDLILTDLRLPGKSGTALIELAPETPVLVMTSYASLKSAIEAMKLGAADYIAKPFNHDEMIALINQHLSQSASSVRSEHDTANLSTNDQNALSCFIGQSPKIKQVLDTLTHAAPTDTNLVIIGPTGTGKAMIAKLAHALSGRTGRMVNIDCGIMHTQTAQEQLCGTLEPGASEPHGSLVFAANRGTLIFEEIGELDASIQSMILRMLASRTLVPLGSTHPIPIDVRLVITSQYPLKQLCEQGRLRSDLYYRLDGIPLILPPLIERDKDSALLARHFLSEYSKRLKKEALELTQESLDFITQYQWPGNVRELKQCIERGAVLTQTGKITPIELFPEINQSQFSLNESCSMGKQPTPPLTPEEYPLKTPLIEAPSLEAYFRRFVLENEQNMTETQIAQALGISRKTLWDRRQKLGIPRRRKLDTQLDES